MEIIGRKERQQWAMYWASLFENQNEQKESSNLICASKRSEPKKESLNHERSRLESLEPKVEALSKCS